MCSDEYSALIYDLKSLHQLITSFLGTFAKLRKDTISFVMCVRLSSVRPHGTAWLSLHAISYLSIFF
jgi:hypothetical protein